MPSLSTENKKRKQTFFNGQVNVNIQAWGQDGWHEVKMAGYWPSSFFARPIFSQPTSLVNNVFIIWKIPPLSWGTKQVIHSRQDSAMLPIQVANHSTGFGSRT